jgi:leucyl/phenylalanyl-tRNA---protein transferase
MSAVLTPAILLAAYASGYFPMAYGADDPEIHWFSPDPRGVLPIAAFNIPRGLARVRDKQGFTHRVNSDFEGVMRACAEINAGRKDTWINEEIIQAYVALHRLGHAHSVETWQNGVLVGGLYGVSIGGAFFGESMFSRVSEASKCALVQLVEILAEAGYMLLDTQYVNEHLKQFGVQAVRKRTYVARLAKALSASPNPSSFFSTVSVRKGLASASSVSTTR